MKKPIYNVISVPKGIDILTLGPESGKKKPEISKFFIGIKSYMKKWRLEMSDWFDSFHADTILCSSL